METILLEEKIKALRLDNRVLKKYTEDLNQKIKDLNDKLIQKEKAIAYCKELLMAKGVRDSSYEKIRQIEMGSIRIRG